MNAGSGDITQWLQHARLLQRAGKWDEAADLFRRILATYPDSSDALHLFGVLHAQRGDYRTAVDLIGRAIALAPENAVAHYNHGRLCVTRAGATRH